MSLAIPIGIDDFRRLREGGRCRKCRLSRIRLPEPQGPHQWPRSPNPGIHALLHGRRPDVTIRPRSPGQPAAVLELKVARKGVMTPAAALKKGLAQILERGYEADLIASGASEVHSFAVAFDGKRVWVRSGGAPGAESRAKKRTPRPAKKLTKKRARKK